MYDKISICREQITGFIPIILIIITKSYMLRKSKHTGCTNKQPPHEGKPPEGEWHQVKDDTTLTYTIVLPLLRYDKS